MYAPLFADVAGPGLLLFAALPIALLGMLLIIPLEALALWLLKWSRFPRALLAALVANLVSGLLGAIFVLLLFVVQNVWLLIFAAFVLSIVVEAFVLMLFKRGEARANWTAALVMNLVSYGLILVPMYSFSLRPLIG